MKHVHRITSDVNSAGAVITGSQQSTVFANDLLISVDNDPVAGHGPGIHASPNTNTPGGRTVFIEDIPVVIEGDSDTCGHARVSGSPNVFVE